MCSAWMVQRAYAAGVAVYRLSRGYLRVATEKTHDADRKRCVARLCEGSDAVNPTGIRDHDARMVR